MCISLCMIVKDEENCLKRCLQSVQGLVSEIIIVDTGSKDSTREIAKQFTDKVYDFDWCNDFSKARNFSLEKASNEWILVLDADEVVLEFYKDKVIDFIKADESSVGRIKRINILEDNMGTKKFIERVNRLFNKKYYHYEGIIHEQVVSKRTKEYIMVNVDIVADHVGYTKEVINKTQKTHRNLELLHKSIKKDDKDPYLYYQLGKTYYLQKNYNEAFNAFSQALSFNLNNRHEYVEDLVETYGYCLLNAGRYEQALELKRYKDDYGRSLDYKFLMALIYMNNGVFEQAVRGFLDCIGESEGKIEGLNSYLSYYNVGVIYECLGFKDEASFYYKQCGEYKPALEALRRL